MSRMIPGRPDHSEETTLRNTEAGKLIFTECRGWKMMFLIRGNQALRICPLQETDDDGIGAVFLGKVKKVVKNISACFVEIQKGKTVFLPLDKAEVDSAFLTNRNSDGRILEGDELLVQIQRKPQKTKQAAATAQISMAGRYVVFHTGTDRVNVSSKLEEPVKKSILKTLREHEFLDSAGKLIRLRKGESFKEMPPFGAVIRTEAAKAEEETWLHEFIELQEQFVQLYETSRYRTCFTCISPAPSVFLEAISQITEAYEEIVTDDERIYREIKEYCQERDLPLRLYADDSYSLGQLYSLNTKLEDALSHRIWLKSGAYLVIDFTEALTAIDVNSGKYDAKTATEEAIFQINLEAAVEIARQLRLRNLSGMILVDFINMESAKYQGQLLREMRALVKDDKVQTRIVDITPLGLMEITRRKVNATLEEQIRRGRIS